MPDLPSGDCFSELKKDLVSADDVSILIADAHKFLKDSKVKLPIVNMKDDAWLTSVETYAKQLLKVKKMNVSGAVKIIAGKERARLEDLARAAKLVKNIDNLPIETVKAEFEYLTSRMGPAKVKQVFGQDYPINVNAYYNITKNQVKLKLAAEANKGLSDIDVELKNYGAAPEMFSAPEDVKTKWFEAVYSGNNQAAHQIYEDVLESLKTTTEVVSDLSQVAVNKQLLGVAKPQYLKTKFELEELTPDKWQKWQLMGFLDEQGYWDTVDLGTIDIGGMGISDLSQIVFSKYQDQALELYHGVQAVAPAATKIHPIYDAMLKKDYLEKGLGHWESGVEWSDEMYQAYAHHFGLMPPVSENSAQAIKNIVNVHFNKLTSSGDDLAALKTELLKPPSPTPQPYAVIGHYYSGGNYPKYTLEDINLAYYALANSKGSGVKQYLVKVGSNMATIDAKSWAKGSGQYGLDTKNAIIADLAKKKALLEEAHLALKSKPPFKLPDVEWVEAPVIPPMPITKKYKKPSWGYDAYVGSHPANAWPTTVKQAWLAEKGIDPTDHDSDWMTFTIQGFLDKEQEAVRKAAEAALKPVFTPLPNQPALSGMHRKVVFTDQAGNRWLGKPMSESFRIDTEDGALKISRALGFSAPDSTVDVIDGRRYHLQKMFDPAPDLTGVDPLDLTDRELQDVFDEHILDWVLANHDSHQQNFMRIKGRMQGVDKGQAYKFFGKDKLAVGYLPPGNGAPVYYDKVYRAITTRQMSKAQADKHLRAALLRARRMAKTNDARVRQLLETSFKDRPASTIPHPTKEAFIDAIMDRKHELEADFERFYRSLYAEAGYDWDIDLTNQIQLENGGFAGLNQPLLDAVSDNGVHGVATFYKSTDLEGGHEFFWEEVWQDAAGTKDRVLVGELKLREDADKKLTEFIRNQPGITVSSHTQGVKAADPLPNNDDWWFTLQNAIKQTNAHVLDGDYNQSYINQAKILKGQLEDVVTAPKNALPAAVKAMGAEDEYQAAAKIYLEAIEKMENAQKTQTKMPKNPDGTFMYTKYQYTPKPKAVSKVEKEVLQVKTTKVQNGFQEGTFDPDTQTVVVDIDDKSRFHALSGQRFLIDLDETTQIEYRPWVGNGVAEQGQLRVIRRKYSGNLEDLDEFHSFMDTVGVSLEAAQQSDVDLLYWRQQLGSIAGRGGDKYQYQPVFDYVAKNVHPGMSPEAEIDSIKDALALKFPRSKIDSADTSPHFSHSNPLRPDAPTGRPFWNRFDITPEELPNLLAEKFPSSRITGGSNQLKVAKSGAMFSTEERLRALHLWIHTMSPDADISSGGANYVFTRLNMSSNSVYFNPDAMLRQTTFSSPGDIFGRIATRNSSLNWDPKSWRSYTAGNNETDFKNNMTVLDDIEVLVFDSSIDRDAAVAFYKNNGITEIRGLPIEDRFVTSGQQANAVKKAWRAWRDRHAIA